MNHNQATPMLNFDRNQYFRAAIIDPNLQSVTRACRDAYSHTLSRDLVPLAELLQDNSHILEDELTYKDNLLPLIVDWFSSEFFSWFQAPNCDECSSQVRIRKTSINQEGQMIEHYACDNGTCDYTYNFVRHNEPAILLHTKTGRCGEWAKCFLVILRALDYDTRIVYDTTDHVWNEVWSDSKQRWVHVDPCESVVDTPLLYEVGWSKKLEYCIAIGQYEITDVTRRYTINFEDTERLRTACDETWLSNYLDNMTEDLLKLAPSQEIGDSIRRKRSEDIKYLRGLSPSSRKIPDKSELAGRKTGSVQWRIARGEYKPSDSSRFVIMVRPNEDAGPRSQHCPLFGLYYNSDGNIYRSTSEQYDGAKNWSLLIYEYQNLDYKYERDWKMSYIARYETCSHDMKGLARWRFDISDSGNWDKLEVFLTCQLYPNTSVLLSLESRASTSSTEILESRSLLADKIFEIGRHEFHKDAKCIDIIAVLEGGDQHDEVAWQKPQLFRQARDSNPNRPSAMSVKFY